MNTDHRFLIKAESKTMKLNLRLLLRTLSTALIGIAALWSMPRNAHAQVYVVQYGSNGSVGEYNVTTGGANPNFITGLDFPYGIAQSGNTLFVSIYGPPTPSLIDRSSITEFDATTGAAIEPNFITGLNDPAGLVLSGNNLFVANFNGAVAGGGSVAEYSAITGAPNPNFTVITGLSAPVGLALSGNDLFVASRSSGTVGEYDATTGAPIEPNFITGLNGPSGLAVSGNNLWVSSVNSGTVAEYDATTGLLNPNFIIIPGLSFPANLAVSGNNLFVSSMDSGTVGEYNATTGAAINANFITGLSDPTGLAAPPIPEPSAWSMIAMGGLALLGIMFRRRHRTAYRSFLNQSVETSVSKWTL
jgi:hypothetical protein